MIFQTSMIMVHVNLPGCMVNGNPPRSQQQVCTCKLMVGRHSFPFRARPIFRGELLVSGSVCIHENPKKHQNINGEIFRIHTWILLGTLLDIFIQHLSQWDCGVKHTSPTLHVKGKTAKLRPLELHSSA